MGNIKHNDELLRINDDGFDVVFNCDNKHQNGVSYHAEKNGKKTKIDPEYAMATLVKKISGGGSGGWPEDMPIPSEGGYGYTEQDEQTESETIHKINQKYLPYQSAPTTDGTYKLVCTVADGVPTYTWESES